jgi:hypothetical protein
MMSTSGRPGGRASSPLPDGAGGSAARRRQHGCGRRVASVLLATLLALAASWHGALAPWRAHAAGIAKVQGALLPQVSVGSSTLNVTLSSPSTAGNLLVVALSGSGSFSTAASGWVNAVSKAGAANSQGVGIWYYPNNPGGISSVTFTTTVSTIFAGEMSEWSGVATSSPLDTTNATTSASTTTSYTLSISPTQSNELVLTDYSWFHSGSGFSFSKGTGWTNLSQATLSNYGFGEDYNLGLTSGSQSETVGSGSNSGTWDAAAVAFKANPCAGGGLSLPDPGAVSFPGVTLSGKDQTASTNVTLQPSDLTGTVAGWNLQATSTTFSAGGHTLPTSATTVTAASPTAASGNCTLPTSSIGYPVSLPAGSPAPTGAKLYNAAGGTGQGPTSLALTFQVTVPAKSYSGTYTSTWTFSIASGP